MLEKMTMWQSEGLPLQEISGPISFCTVGTLNSLNEGTKERYALAHA